MAAEHAPPPGEGAAGREPTPRAQKAGDARGETAVVAGAPRPGGHLADARPVAPRGAGGAAARGSRLLPSGPALEHAPLLLGLDAAGDEHPQGGDHPDDEDLVGRVWGCGCGWRGTARDVSGRPFHPRVGDGGRLRRQRLARSDRDSRAEVEAHLARFAPAPADPATTTRPVVPLLPVARTAAESSSPDRAEKSRPRGRRRRLTVPRDTPLATPTQTVMPTGFEPVVDDELEAPVEDAGEAASSVSLVEPPAPPAAPTTPEPGATPGQRLEAPAEEGDIGPSERGTVELLADAIARADSARSELTAAEFALDAAVAVAREDGLSWRTIGRATGLEHPEAAARWGPTGGGPSL